MDVVDLGVGGEQVLGLGEAPQDDGLDPLAAAYLEPLVPLGGRDDIPIPVAGQVVQPLPRHDLQVFRLFEAGDEEVGDGLPQVFVGRLPGQVLEADDGDRMDGALGLGDDFPDDDARHHDAQESEDRDERFPPGKGRSGGRPRRFPRRGLGPGGGQRRCVDRLLDLTEVAADLLGRLVSLLAVLLHAPENDGAQLGRRLRVQILGQRRPLGLLLESDDKGRVGGERQPPGDHLEEDDAEGIDVGPLVGVPAIDLLGRHVLGRADDTPLGRDALGSDGPGDAEVQDLGVPFLVDHDVAGLEVAVDDARVVGLVQAAADLLGDGYGRGYVEPPRAPDEALQVLSGHVLHGDIVEALVLAEMVHLADVAVGDLVDELDFVDETVECPLVLGDVGADELDGHLFAGLRVDGPVDAPHASPAQLFDDLIAAAEDRTGRKVPGPGFVGLGDRKRQGLGAGAFAGPVQGGGAMTTVVRRLRVLGLAGWAEGGHRPSLSRLRSPSPFSSDPPCLILAPHLILRFQGL